MSKQTFASGTGMGSGNGPAIRRGAYVGSGYARAGVMLGSGNRLGGAAAAAERFPIQR
jgi:hypothetical protein